MRWFGLSIALAGLVLVVRSGMLLAGHGRPRRGPRPRLVIAGPYLWLRNPLFAGVVTLLAGVAVALRSLELCAIAVMAAGAAHLWVIAVEEPALRKRFGRAYAAYLQAVPRWRPRTPCRVHAEPRS